MDCHFDMVQVMLYVSLVEVINVADDYFKRGMSPAAAYASATLSFFGGVALMAIIHTVVHKVTSANFLSLMTMLSANSLSLMTMISANSLSLGFSPRRARIVSAAVVAARGAG